MQEPKIRRVYKFNEMVMVFDQHGEQMPEYQGLYERVRDKILADAGDDVEFISGNWRERGIEKLSSF